MSNYDRTGPMGRGERTGRGMGRCVDNATGSVSQKNPGYGYGRGRGGRGGCGGRGFGYGQQRYYETRRDVNYIQPVNSPEMITKEDLRQELESLKNQQNAMSEAILAIEKKIAD